MPMDIRNFFGKKTSTTTTNATATTTTKKTNNDTSASSNKKSDNTTGSTNNASTKSTASDRTNKSETTKTTNAVKNKSNNNKNKDSTDTNDNADVRKQNVTKKSTPISSSSTTTSKATTRTTTTTSDKKRNSTESKASSSANKKRLVIVDSDDDDDEDFVVPIDDSDDDDYESDKKGGSKPKSSSSKIALTPNKRKDGPDESKYFYQSNTDTKKVVSPKVGNPSPQKKLRASPRSESIIDEENDVSIIPRRISPRKPPPKPQEPAPDNSDNDEIEIITKTPAKSTSLTTTSSSLSKPVSNKVTRSNSSSTAKQKKQTKQQQQQRDPPLQPEIEADYFDVNTAIVPQLLDQYTFVLSGVLESLSRDDAQEMIKVLGGRVTTAVSSKTDYLVVGMELEDGRPYTEGSKFKKATDLGTIIVHGERALFGLLKQYNDKAAASTQGNDDDVIPMVKSVASSPMIVSSTRVATKESPTITNTQSSTEKKAAAVPSSNNVASASVAMAGKPQPFNPYSKAQITNPYASKNPYAKKAPPPASTTNPYATKPPAKTADSKMPASSSSSSGSTSRNQLWVDKYKPTHSSEVLGNQDAVRKLSTWLATWEDKFNNPQSIGKSFSAPSGPWKAALLSGPPGIGKTTTATLVAQESGRDVLEFNASDVRSKRAMQDELGDIIGSRTIEFTMKVGGKNKAPQRTKRCIIMDEVDGMGGGDRSGISELIQMIKHSRVPIICICNDRQNQKLKSLIPYCMDLKYRRPVKSVIANRAVEIAEREGLYVERNAAEAIIESCGNDVRQVLNCLQMWASSGTKSSNSMTYKDLKEREHSINKDEILRVGLFDATRLIVEGRRGLAGADLQTERNNFFQRNDAFFVDYSFIGLMVQQNYLKVMQGQFNEVKRMNDDVGTLAFLDRMSDAANTMSEFATVENSMRDGQGWGLLPFSAALAVKTGFHAGGERGGMLPGFPEFTTWLGRNSSKGKKVRMLKELGHHMNFNISAGSQELRLSYLPVFRERFLAMLTNNKIPNVDGAIELMDEYGLDRDDLFEKIEEFKMDPKGRDLSSMDSKMKAAFTRAYNQGVHKSQALVAEQGATGKKGKRQGSSNPIVESADLDAIDDDHVAEVDEENDDEEEELDEAKIKEMFKKKGRGGGGARTATTSKSRASKKK